MSPGMGGQWPSWAGDDGLIRAEEDWGHRALGSGLRRSTAGIRTERGMVAGGGAARGEGVHDDVWREAGSGTRDVFS
jgi:hypothetical protein